jgi:uncharacterized protein YqhQ
MSLLRRKRKLFRLPVLRGAVGLIEMLIVGLRALNFSAEAALEPTGKSFSGNGNGKPSGDSNSGENLRLGLTLAAALCAGAAIFFLTPLLITTAWFHVDQQPLAFNLIAGAIRLTLFLGYLLAISTMKDVRRLFEYHGAEHKVVFTFEQGETSRLIPRRGIRGSIRGAGRASCSSSCLWRYSCSGSSIRS